MSHYEKKNPLDLYPKPPFPEQEQQLPGLARKMTPRPDHGEESYVGLGRLKGFRGIVTGGDSGIGRAAAIALSREGADLALNYLPSEQADAEEVRDLLVREGRKVVLLPGDISDEQFCRDLVERAVAELGGLDTLVMVAGHQESNGDITTMTTASIDQTMKTNVYSLFWLTQAALPHLEPGSSIVTTGSIQGAEPSPDKLDYALTKGAIGVFTAGLAQQLAPKGIRVNSIAPGPIWTPLQPASSDGETVAHFGEQAPYGRPGQPAELGAAYVHLVSPESSYTSGATITIAGGTPAF
ncbi:MULTISPECIES: SDR family oxidoreductase [unclassified Pseudoclavibacter]|uniref:SDR family oxidoreductase n=1 Tax=unclassified Pseudoclavibacter TaxID=2615177 RepID=UPI000CE7E9D6|nr:MULTISPECIES: SDR family oxidoreductase [unclassified Pseudoclavibacter]MBS3178688.1 SDR family oxidoreductase [Pseudoclavibacter sp. Marseille-Q4354]PPG27633.1 NAD(P)-dependent dehydrogenase [Pseudoclavibacter sp. RFBB5]